MVPLTGSSVPGSREGLKSGNRLRTAATVTLAVLAAVAALYLGRGLLIPIALALFFNTLLRPLIRKLHNAGIPAPIGAALMVLALIGVLGGIGVVLWPQGKHWLSRAPETMHLAHDRLESVWGAFQQVSDAASDLGTRGDSTAATVQTVTVSPPQAKILETLGPTATLAAGAVEVLLMVYLLLASGGVFLERLVGILPTRADKRAAVDIAREVEAAVSQYLVTTTVINIGEGLLVGLAMWGLGMPAPALLGVLTVGLEFVPYLGSAVFVVALLVVAIGTFDNMGHAVLVPLSYLVISALQNYVVSPLLYGNRLKLNAVAVLIAVLFWWYLWGVVGAFLAVPLLAAGKILCDHIEALGSVGKFLEA